jgi:hypothetical protein
MSEEPTFADRITEQSRLAWNAKHPGLPIPPPNWATSDQAAADFEGHPDRECGEHRTVGAHRAWCYDCSEWCYPSTGCKGCELPALRKQVAELQAQDERNLAEMAFMGRELEGVRARLNVAAESFVQLQAISDGYKAGLDRERAKVAAVLDLHKPVALGYNNEWECCEVCTATTAFRVRWPCVTARALGVEEA